MIVHTKGILNFWSVKKVVSLAHATLMRKKACKRKIQLSFDNPCFLSCVFFVHGSLPITCTKEHCQCRYCYELSIFDKGSGIQIHILTQAWQATYWAILTAREYFVLVLFLPLKIVKICFMSMFICVYVYHMHTGLLGGQKRASNHVKM